MTARASTTVSGATRRVTSSASCRKPRTWASWRRWNFWRAMPGCRCPRANPKAAEKADRATELAKATEAAVGYFRLQLKTQAAAEARAYLERRGLTQPILDRFEIGFAPGARNATHQALVAKGIPTDHVIEAGLATRPDDGGAPYDAFPRPDHVPDPRPARALHRLRRPRHGPPMRAPSTSTAAKPRSSTRAARSTITGPPAAPPGRGSRLSWPRATWT